MRKTERKAQEQEALHFRNKKLDEVLAEVRDQRAILAELAQIVRSTLGPIEPEQYTPQLSIRKPAYAGCGCISCQQLRAIDAMVAGG